MNNIPSSAILMMIAVVAAGLLAVFIFTTVTSNASAVRKGDAKSTKMESDLSEAELTRYDNEEITGAELLNLIKSCSGKEISIAVDNKVSNHTYIYGYDFTTGDFLPTNVGENALANAQDRSSTWYISPSQTYVGTVRRNGTNGAVVQLYFQAKDSAGGTMYDVDPTPTPTKHNEEEDATFYYIYYMSNGGSGSSVEQKVKTGTVAVIKDCTFKKKNYLFTGWTDDPKSTTIKYHPGDSYMSSDSTTLYAVWKKVINEMYTISFDTMGGDDISDMSVEEGTDVKALPTPTRTGYVFAGWYFKRDYTGRQVTGFLDVSENTRLYAKWTEKVNTVKFDGNGGTVDFGNGRTGSTMSIEVNDGETVPVIPSASYTGYQLDGWYDTSTGERLTSGTKITSDRTYKAQYTRSTMTIHFDKNFGEGTMSDMTAKYGESITLPENPFTPRQNTEFAGWGEVPQLGGKTYKPGDKISNTYTSDSSMTLYALWKEKK